MDFRGRNMNKKVLIYGATVTAAAIASLLKENCTIINYGYNCGFEYGDAYRTSMVFKKASYSRETLDFIEDMEKRNILKDGYIHPLSLAGLTALYIKTSGAKVYLGSTLEKTGESQDDVTSEFYLNGEKIIVSADVFIDTTDFGTCERYLCAALHSEKSNPYVPNNGLIKKGRFENEYYLQMKVKPSESYTDAFMRLNTEWINGNFSDLSDFKIASVANAFSSAYENPVFVKQNNIIHIPSASFKNAAESFEGGLKCISHI